MSVKAFPKSLGTTTSPATNVTVNTSNAVIYADVTFASTNQPWVNGNNTFTAIAKDAYGRRDTNSITVLQATNVYAYDLNGNLLYDGRRAFAYDDENQLIRVTVTNGWKSEFTYDGKLRRRIVKEFTWNGSWVQTNEVHYIYDGNLVVQERDANNLLLVTYTRGSDLSGSMQGAGGIGGLLARTDNSKQLISDPFATAFYHADGNGNVTCLIYPNQTIAAKYLYDPFGNMLSMYGTLADANNYRFSSKEWNANSALYYYLYRFYDSNLQRWPNRDPIGERGGLNLYGYVGNNPINKFDPYGLDFWQSPGYYNWGWPGSKPPPPQPTDPVAVANSMVGSWQYNAAIGNPFDNYSSGVWTSIPFIQDSYRRNKCNKFVGDCISECPNRPKPFINGRFPTAAEWGDPNVTIPGYGSPHTGIQPGDVITDGVHVGFMNYNGNYVEASSGGAVKSLDPSNNNTGWNPGTGRTPIP